MHCSTFSSSVSVFSSKVSTNNIMSSTFTAPGSSLGGCQGINLPLSLFKPFCRSLKNIHKKWFYLKNKTKQKKNVNNPTTCDCLPSAGGVVETRPPAWGGGSESQPPASRQRGVSVCAVLMELGGWSQWRWSHPTAGFRTRKNVWLREIIHKSQDEQQCATYLLVMSTETGFPGRVAYVSSDLSWVVFLRQSVINHELIST